MPRYFTKVEKVDDFLKFLKSFKNEQEHCLELAQSKSENADYLKGAVDCLKTIEDACRVYGLDDMGEGMKHFDVDIKLNVVAKDEQDCRQEVDYILSAIAQSGLENIISIKEVGEYLE